MSIARVPPPVASKTTCALVAFTVVKMSGREPVLRCAKPLGLVAASEVHNPTVLNTYRSRRCFALTVSVLVKALFTRVRDAALVFRAKDPREVPSRSCPVSVRCTGHCSPLS